MSLPTEDGVKSKKDTQVSTTTTTTTVTEKDGPLGESRDAADDVTLSGDRRIGKTRVWGARSLQIQRAESASGSGMTDRCRPNNFGPVAATFMLPLMLKFDEKKQGVQMLEDCDVPVLAQLLTTLGDCILCCRGLPHARVGVEVRVRAKSAESLGAEFR